MINKDFTERYKAVLPILENNLESIKNTKSFTKDNIVIGAYLLMEGKSDASVETLKTLNLDDVKQKEDYEVYEFLMYMCLNGYYDKNFLDREDLSEEHIGYNGFSDAFCAILKFDASEFCNF